MLKNFKNFISRGISNEFKSNHNNEYENIQDYIDYLFSKFYNNIGNSHRKLKNLREGLKFYELSIEQLEKIKNNLLKINQKFKSYFNIGTILFELGNFSHGINFLLVAEIKENPIMKKYLVSKGYNFLLENKEISDAILDYFNKKFKRSVIKLKKNYFDGANPITNFFMALNYINLQKVNKAICFFDKLFKLNKILNLEEKKLFRKILKKSTLIYNIISKSKNSELGDTYICDLVDFNDFEHLSKLEKYENEYEESINDLINIDINILNSNSNRIINSNSIRFKGNFSILIL